MPIGKTGPVKAGFVFLLVAARDLLDDDDDNDLREATWGWHT